MYSPLLISDISLAFVSAHHLVPFQESYYQLVDVVDLRMEASMVIALLRDPKGHLVQVIKPLLGQACHTSHELLHLCFRSCHRNPKTICIQKTMAAMVFSSRQRCY